MTNFIRGITFKKDYETTTNGSEETDHDEDDPMHGKYFLAYSYFVLAFENNLQKSFLTMMPNSTFKFVWDIFMLLCIFFFALLIPYNLSFGLTGTNILC